MFWNREVETLTRIDMVAWQNHKVKRIIERIYEKSSFYSKIMEENSIKPADIQAVDDLVKLPLTNRQDVADNYPYGLLTMPMSGVSHIHTNQDVENRPTAVSYTRNDMVMWTELMARMLVAGGVNVTSVFQVAVNGQQYPGSLGLHYGVQQVGATFVPADGENMDQQIVLMQDFSVTAIFSTPGYLLALAQTMKKIGIVPEQLPLQTVFCGIQPLTGNTAERIEEEYKVQVLELYGLEEIFGMGIGGECHCADGLHIQEDCFYPEVVETMSGQVLPAGQVGELVLTSLTLEAMPLIRYRTGRRGYLDYSPCICGRTLVRLKK